jgi:4-hydroxy-3-methylbut-2-enyl diphosphate reductase
MALRDITDVTDLVLVVGDPKSSNSNRLREVASRRGIESYLIHNEKEIKSEWVLDKKIIGLTAGASTPEEVVQKCIQRLMELGVDEVEDVVFTHEDVVFQLPKPIVNARF